MLRLDIILCAVARNRNTKSSPNPLRVTIIGVYAIVKKISYFEFEGKECTLGLEGVTFTSIKVSFGWSRQVTVGLLRQIVARLFFIQDHKPPVFLSIPRLISIAFYNDTGIYGSRVCRSASASKRS